MIASQNHLHNLNPSQCRLVIVGLIFGMLAALLALGTQFLVDINSGTLSEISVQSDIPSPVSDGPGYIWSYSSKGRTLGTPYTDMTGKPIYPEKVVTTTFKPSIHQQQRWNDLWYQLQFLSWLQENGNRIGCFASFSALLMAWIVYLFAHFINRPKRNLNQVNES